jgi:signal transduction histidine kinase
VTRRVFIALVGVTALAVVLFAVPLGVVIARIDRDQAVLRLQRQATETAVLVPDDERFGAPITLGSAPPGGQLAFYDPAGARLAGTGPDSADAVTHTALSGAPSDADVDGQLVATVPVSDDQRVIGAVRIAEPQAVVDSDVHRAWLALTLLGLATIAVASVVALLLSRRLARPWRQLEQRSRRLGDGDFTVSAELTGIGEIDRANAALDETSTRLAGLIERERQFSADASHQLRTPLTALGVIIETELARPRSDPTIALQSALNEVDRLARTIDSLLSAARDDTRQRHALDLASVLRDAVDRWQDKAADRGRVLQLHVDDGLPRPVASQTVIEHIVDVLVSNALEHGRGMVTIGAYEIAATGVGVQVSDEGPLIDDVAALFRRRDANAAGHGIGLALASTLAAAEGGRLWLSENTETATTFELLLPVPPSPTDPRPIEPAAQVAPVEGGDVVGSRAP